MQGRILASSQLWSAVVPGRKGMDGPAVWAISGAGRMTTRRRSKRLTARQRRALLLAFDDDARKLEARFEAELLRTFNALGREAARAMREATR